jgi:hypothetical protein
LWSGDDWHRHFTSSGNFSETGSRANAHQIVDLASDINWVDALIFLKGEFGHMHAVDVLETYVPCAMR